MIKDSRHMYGVSATTPEEVRAAWDAYLSERIMHGRPPFAEDPSVNSWRRSDKRLKPYISEGRWVASCPRCNGGIAVWTGMPDAACYDCGRVFSDIKWPTADKILKAERVLMKRPSLKNMNWRPEVETVADLKAQNALEGYDFTDTPSQYEQTDDTQPYTPPSVVSTPTDDITMPDIPGSVTPPEDVT